MKTQWFVSTDMIGKPGSPKTAGPFSTRDDAFAARIAMERMGANLSVFEEEVAPESVVPTKVTLGWIESSSYRQLGRWKRDPDGDAGEYDIHGDRVNTWYGVQAFTPATAVPTSALDELRQLNMDAGANPDPEIRARRRFDAIDRFLAAVDKAGDPRWTPAILAKVEEIAATVAAIDATLDRMLADDARHAAVVESGGDECDCWATEVKDGMCVLCGKPFPVGGSV